MYHFVKFNNTWYLKPNSVTQIIEHFKTICAREFEYGFNDFKNGVRVKNNGLVSLTHSNTLWRTAVELVMNIKKKNWLKTANELEILTYKDRIDLFNNGKLIYLSNGLPYYTPKEEPQYDKEEWREDLVYPTEYNYDDVRFIRWDDGKHWYAKIGDIDICDQYGNYKSTNKYYMMRVAKQWCECGGDWSKKNYKFV